MSTHPESDSPPPAAPDLVHCVYCSALTQAQLTPGELKSLLLQCRQNNARLGVTGVLLYMNRSFFQVLEGERDIVAALYDKIAQDTRHQKVSAVMIEPIAQRDFAAWAMGYPKVMARQLAGIAGLNDFFAHGTSYMQLGEAGAKVLLDALTQARWQAELR